MPVAVEYPRYDIMVKFPLLVHFCFSVAISSRWGYWTIVVGNNLLWLGCSIKSMLNAGSVVSLGYAM